MEGARPDPGASGRGSSPPASTTAELDAIDAEARAKVAAAEAGRAGRRRSRRRRSSRPRSGPTAARVAELTVPETTYRQAVAMGIAQEMERDPTVVLIGEDVGAAGGVFKLTEGLFERFGPERVRDTPISEQAIVGAAMGAAMTGLRPDRRADVQRLLRGDLGHGRQPDRQDPLHDRRPGLAAARPPHRERRRASASAPSTARAIENWAMAIPGLKVVAPSTPADMMGLMAAAIRDPDPVIVCEHKAPLRDEGRGARRRARRAARPGARSSARAPTCTIVALAAMVPRALEAAERLARRPRDRRRGHRPPLARPARRRRRSSQSVAKTSRLFTVEENPRLCGWGAEIASIVADEGF